MRKISLSVGRAVIFGGGSFRGNPNLVHRLFGGGGLMYILYVDESGDCAPLGSSHLILGAAALFEGKWASLEQESPGLQLADLCAYFVCRVVTANDDSIAKLIASSFDREPLRSSKTPGKCHGIKFIATDPVVRARLDAIWVP